MPEYTTYLTVVQEADSMEAADERLGAALDRHWIAISTWTTMESDKDAVARDRSSEVEGREDG